MYKSDPRYFCQRLVGTKTELKKSVNLDLSSLGVQKQNFKWMLMLLHVYNLQVAKISNNTAYLFIFIPFFVINTHLSNIFLFL